MFARKMLEDNSCVCWSLKEISHFCATSTRRLFPNILTARSKSRNTFGSFHRRFMIYIYMFLWPKTFWIVPSERLFFRKECCHSRKSSTIAPSICYHSASMVDPLTNMTCIHTMLRSWRSFGTPYPTKIANKAGHTENSRVPLWSHHLREIPVEVTGGRVISH